MKSRVEMQHPKNLNELKAVSVDAWANQPPATINGLIAQMPTRVAQVITEEGRTIHHL
jgi:hypothetical protein